MLPRFYYFFVFVIFASRWRQGLGDFMSISIDVEFFFFLLYPVVIVIRMVLMSCSYVVWHSLIVYLILEYLRFSVWLIINILEFLIFIANFF
jgi:hypothetical protein